VYMYGLWGTVCDHSFSDVDAKVACRQLGFGCVAYSSACCMNCCSKSSTSVRKKRVQQLKKRKSDVSLYRQKKQKNVVKRSYHAVSLAIQ